MTPLRTGHPSTILSHSGWYAESRMSGPRKLSQTAFGRCSWSVNAPGEAVTGMKAAEAPFDIETIFRAQYERIARIIARVIEDPARAEELAVEVFLKLWRNPRAQGE